jgi:small subunit ribosomal protein S6
MRTREYEAMFLLNNDAATADFEGTAGQVDRILEKNGAKIVRKEKWDERKLAYEIKGQRRATYYLVYFSAPTSALAEVRRDLNLNETVLRHLVIGLDEPIAEHIEKRAAERERLAEESRKASLASGWGERRGRGREGEDDFDDMEIPAEARAVPDLMPDARSGRD